MAPRGCNFASRTDHEEDPAKGSMLRCLELVELEMTLENGNGRARGEESRALCWEWSSTFFFSLRELSAWDQGLARHGKWSDVPG